MAIIEIGERFNGFVIGQRVMVVENSTYRDVKGVISAFGNGGMVLVSPDEGTDKGLYWSKNNREDRKDDVGYGMRILNSWLAHYSIKTIKTEIDDDGNLV